MDSNNQSSSFKDQNSGAGAHSVLSGHHSGNMSRKRIKIAVIISLCLALVLAIGLYGLTQVKAVKAQAKELKNDVKIAAKSFIVGNPDEIDASLDTLEDHSVALRSKLKTPLFKFAAILPVASDEFKSAFILLDCLDTADGEILRPAAELMRAYPLSSIKEDKDSIAKYCSFVDGIIPVVSGLSSDMENIHLKIADPDGKIAGYIELFTYATGLLENAPADIIHSITELLTTYPISSIKTEDSINDEAVDAYLKWIIETIPRLRSILESVDADRLGEIGQSDSFKALYAAALDSVTLCEKANESLLVPFYNVYKTYPISVLKTGDGFSAPGMREYILLLGDLMPEIEEAVSDLNGIDFSAVSALEEKKIKAVEFGQSLIDLYYDAEKYLPLVMSVLGNGEDRTFLIAAQNTAEIRASGGFPGSVGTLTVRDGILEIGDFKTVYDVFPEDVKGYVRFEEDELYAFSGFIGIPRDTGHNPNFERVAQVWSVAYYANCDTTVDGVISMTPAIIQDLLAAYGEEITLFDGRVLNGENATLQLQHLMYTDYLEHAANYSAVNAILDALFAESAEKAMSVVTSSLNPTKLHKLLTVMEERMSERVVMLWFADEEMENLVRELGCSGGLSHNAEGPVAGVYISGKVACKLGWYVGLNIEETGSVLNADGSRTYDITVTLDNCITQDEVSRLSDAVLGIAGGSYRAAYRLHATFFAPEGGSISDLMSNSGAFLDKGYYDSLQYYRLDFYLHPGERRTVTYKITTAPGVDAPLSFSTTPTLQDYWEEEFTPYYTDTGPMTALLFPATGSSSQEASNSSQDSSDSSQMDDSSSQESGSSLQE